MRKRLKDVAEIRFCLAPRTVADKQHKVLTPIKLLQNNVIDGFVLDNKIRADSTTKINCDDIIIKRISPSFVNYVEFIEDDVYAAGNLIIVTATEVDAKFLACILNTEILQITQSQTGSKIPSVGRSDLEEIQVPILPMNKQKAIGELWQKSITLYKLKSRLNELELAKTQGMLGKMLDGGKSDVG